MKSAKGAISWKTNDLPKPVDSTNRTFFFSTITILRICISLSVTFSLPVTCTHLPACTAKFTPCCSTSFSDDKKGAELAMFISELQTKNSCECRHAQFNRRSGIFGLQSGLRSRPLVKENEDAGYQGVSVPF